MELTSHLPGFLEEIEGDLYVLVTYCCAPDSTPRLRRLLSQVSVGHEPGQGLVGSFGSGSLTKLHGQGSASQLTLTVQDSVPGGCWTEASFCPRHMGPSIEHRSAWPHGSCPFPVCEQRAGFESAGGWQPVLIPRSQRDHPTSATFSLPEASPVHAGGERVAEGEFREAGYWDPCQKLPSPAHLFEGQNWK